MFAVIQEPTRTFFQNKTNYHILHPRPPPPGTRVRRGPHWKWGDQDGGRVGTVVDAGGTPGQLGF